MEFFKRCGDWLLQHPHKPCSCVCDRVSRLVLTVKRTNDFKISYEITEINIFSAQFVANCNRFFNDERRRRVSHKISWPTIIKLKAHEMIADIYDAHK